MAKPSAKTTAPAGAPKREAAPQQRKGGRTVDGVEVPAEESQGRPLEDVARRDVPPGGE